MRNDNKTTSLQELLPSYYPVASATAATFSCLPYEPHLHDLLLLRARGKFPLNLGVALLDEQAEPGRRSRLAQLAVLTVSPEQSESPLASTTDLRSSRKNKNGVTTLSASGDDSPTGDDTPTPPLRPETVPLPPPPKKKIKSSSRKKDTTNGINPRPRTKKK